MSVINQMLRDLEDNQQRGHADLAAVHHRRRRTGLLWLLIGVMAIAIALLLVPQLRAFFGPQATPSAVEVTLVPAPTAALPVAHHDDPLVKPPRTLSEPSVATIPARPNTSSRITIVPSRSHSGDPAQSMPGRVKPAGSATPQAAEAGSTPLSSASAPERVRKISVQPAAKRSTLRSPAARAYQPPPQAQKFTAAESAHQQANDRFTRRDINTAVAMHPSAGTAPALSVTRSRKDPRQRAVLLWREATRTPARANKLLRQALQISPRSGDIRVDLIARLVFARATRQAEVVVNAGLRLQPETPTLIEWKARLLMARKKPALAMQWLQRGSSIKSSYLGLEAALAGQLGMNKMARDLYLRLLKLQPGHGPWYLGLALARLKLNDRAGARNALLAAAKSQGLSLAARHFIQQKLQQLEQ